MRSRPCSGTGEEQLCVLQRVCDSQGFHASPRHADSYADLVTRRDRSRREGMRLIVPRTATTRRHQRCGKPPLSWRASLPKEAIRPNQVPRRRTAPPTRARSRRPGGGQSRGRIASGGARPASTEPVDADKRSTVAATRTGGRACPSKGANCRHGPPPVVCDSEQGQAAPTDAPTGSRSVQRRTTTDPLSLCCEPPTAVSDRGAHPFLALLNRGVRQTDDHDPGHPGADVDLDLDQHPVQADDRAAVNLRQHRPDLRRRRLPRPHLGSLVDRLYHLGRSTVGCASCRPVPRHNACISWPQTADRRFVFDHPASHPVQIRTSTVWSETPCCSPVDDFGYLARFYRRG